MNNEFERALAKVLVHEGGYSNHPADPGGATMRGVTQAVYDDYRRANGDRPRPVKQLMDEELRDIYKARYWDLVKGDSLPQGLSYVVFDGGVNSGVSRSVKWLQKALGVNQDGLVGPATLAAVERCTDIPALIDRICDIRLTFLKSLKTWKTFGNGWGRRVEGVRAVGKMWAGRADIAPPAPSQASQKAREADVKKAPPKAPGDLAVGGGTVGVVVSQSIDQLKPLAENDYIAKVVAVLTVISVAITIGGLAYRMWAKYKADKLAEATA